MSIGSESIGVKSIGGSYYQAKGLNLITAPIVAGSVQVHVSSVRTVFSAGNNDLVAQPTRVECKPQDDLVVTPAVRVSGLGSLIKFANAPLQALPAQTKTDPDELGRPYGTLKHFDGPADPQAQSASTQALIYKMYSGNGEFAANSAQLAADPEHNSLSMPQEAKIAGTSSRGSNVIGAAQSQSARAQGSLTGTLRITALLNSQAAHTQGLLATSRRVFGDCQVTEQALFTGLGYKIIFDAGTDLAAGAALIEMLEPVSSAESQSSTTSGLAKRIFTNRDSDLITESAHLQAYGIAQRKVAGNAQSPSASTLARLARGSKLDGDITGVESATVFVDYTATMDNLVSLPSQATGYGQRGSNVLAPIQVDSATVVGYGQRGSKTDAEVDTVEYAVTQAYAQRGSKTDADIEITLTAAVTHVWLLETQDLHAGAATVAAYVQRGSNTFVDDLVAQQTHAHGYAQRGSNAQGDFEVTELATVAGQAQRESNVIANILSESSVVEHVWLEQTEDIAAQPTQTSALVYKAMTGGGDLVVTEHASADGSFWFSKNATSDLRVTSNATTLGKLSRVSNLYADIISESVSPIIVPEDADELFADPATAEGAGQRGSNVLADIRVEHATTQGYGQCGRKIDADITTVRNASTVGTYGQRGSKTDADISTVQAASVLHDWTNQADHLYADPAETTGYGQRGSNLHGHMQESAAVIQGYIGRGVVGSGELVVVESAQLSGGGVRQRNVFGNAVVREPAQVQHEWTQQTQDLAAHATQSQGLGYKSFDGQGTLTTESATFTGQGQAFKIINGNMQSQPAVPGGFGEMSRIPRVYGNIITEAARTQGLIAKTTFGNGQAQADTSSVLSDSQVIRNIVESDLHVIERAIAQGTGHKLFYIDADLYKGSADFEGSSLYTRIKLNDQFITSVHLGQFPVRRMFVGEILIYAR